jgi:gamma-glutamylcyclotransferase (GGCT)/AIG2-like uncharacterized protein YtfP
MMPDSASASRHLFVYGTLRRGGSNDIARFLPPAHYVADAVVAGTLYDLGDYPGALLGGVGMVRGEVYRIGAALEAQLDALEEVEPDGSGEYAKRELEVDAGGRQLACLVYEIRPDRVVGRPVIAGGDWMLARRVQPGPRVE